ncbi:hypothetical protein AB0H71_32635 [Nocardia sp. NPDC050697]|uniref:hypothetical protein n=1 Tax=Nocardia sp. NPDC050697 TaxID=3155158 RepID=UPI00340759DF
MSDSLSDAPTSGSASLGWEVSVRCHAHPVDEHTEFAEVLDTIGPHSETEDVVIYLTDLPLRQGTTPVLADVSVPDRFAVISIPGLGGAFGSGMEDDEAVRTAAYGTRRRQRFDRTD